MRTVVLCETAADIEAARAHQAAGATVVALTPSAWMAADAAGTPCAILDDFCSEWELAELREPVLDAQLSWMDRMDAALHAAAPGIAAHGLRMSRLWFYCLKRLIDPLTVMAFAIEGALDALQPERLVLPRRQKQAHDWPSFFRVGPHGRMDVPHYAMADVAEAVAAARGISVSRLDGGSDGYARPAARGGARGVFRRNAPAWLLDASALVRKFGFAGARHLVSFRSGGKRLLVVRGGYDLDLVVDAVSSEFQIEYWSRAETRARLGAGEGAAVGAATAACETLWASLEKEPWFRLPFLRGGVDAYGFAREGLRHFVTRTVPESFAYYLRARSSIRAAGHRAVLAPAAMRATSLLAAARAEGVPVFIYQHGGFVGTCEHVIWDFCDFAHADMLVVYGEGEQRYFERRRRRYSEPRAAVRAAGSARLERQIESTRHADVAAARQAIGAPPGGRVVLYAATMASGFSRMIAAESYPETRCFLNQVRALEAMKEFPDVTFVFKPYSDRDDRAIREMAARRGVTNCRVIADLPLMRLMQASDAVLVEFPSTALLEAAVTGKPLAVLIDRESLRLEADAGAELRERAIVAESFEEFLAALRALASGAQPIAPSSASAFARAYALDPDRPALAAAVAALRELTVSKAS